MVTCGFTLAEAEVTCPPLRSPPRFDTYFLPVLPVETYRWIRGRPCRTTMPSTAYATPTAR